MSVHYGWCHYREATAMTDTPIGDELADKILGTPADQQPPADPPADHVALLDGGVEDETAADPGAYEAASDEDPPPMMNDDAEDPLDDVPEGEDDGDTDLDDVEEVAPNAAE